VKNHLTAFEQHYCLKGAFVLGEKNAVENQKADNFTETVEEVKEVSAHMFGPEDRKLLKEMLQRLNDIKEALDVIQFKLGVERGVWRKFPDGDVEWTFAQTMDGEQAEELEEIVSALNKNEYGSWVQIGTFEYRWSGTDNAPRKFIHRRLAK